MMEKIEPQMNTDGDKHRGQVGELQRRPDLSCRSSQSDGG